jgi:hypothetical protein
MPTRGATPDEPPPADEPPYDPYDDLDEGEPDVHPHELLAKHLGAEQIDETDEPAG